MSRKPNAEQAEFSSPPTHDAEGVVCTLSSVHYMVHGTVGSNPGTMQFMHFALDTGEVCNIIRR